MRISKKTFIYILTLTMMMFSITGCQIVDVNIAEKEFTGMDKSDIVRMLGEPDEVEELTKSTEYIFGPIEGLWDQIEMGEKIVIWKYKDSDGYKELYFLNDESEVVGEFYWYNDPNKNPVF